MKRHVESIVIEQYMASIDQGQIVARPNSGGVGLLRRLRQNLQALLDGDHPDDVLGIERRSGQERKPRTFLLAVAIHNSRKNRVAWKLIKRQVDDFLHLKGERTLSMTRIKQLPYEYAEEIQQREEMSELYAALEKSGVPRK